MSERFIPLDLWRKIIALRRHYRYLFTDAEWADLISGESPEDKEWLRKQEEPAIPANRIQPSAFRLPPKTKARLMLMADTQSRTMVSVLIEAINREYERTCRDIKVGKSDTEENSNNQA